jgi:uncharacterized protein (TIGR04222 family)
MNVQSAPLAQSDATRTWLFRLNRWQSRWLPTLIVALVVALLNIGPAALNAFAASNDFGQPVPGTHVYDRAGALTPDQMAALERVAEVVAAAGAPVVVYVQADSADYDETEDDAKKLMDAWDLQSAPDARDGLVLFLNLKPNDLKHGQFAFYAGKSQLSGNLPQYELQRIFDDQMKPLMAKGDLAGGLSAGLQAVADSLNNGPAPPPEPSAFTKFARSISDGPVSLLNVLALFFAAIYAWFARSVWHSRPRSMRTLTPTTVRPGDMQPALVGALVAGKISNDQIVATVLDLARRGALTIEQSGKKQVDIRLIDASLVRGDVEESVWHSLSVRADDDQIVSSHNIEAARGDWDEARKLLRAHLENRGWFDPHASAKRRPVYLATVGLVVLLVAAFVFVVAGQRAWGAVSLGLLFGAIVGGFGAMMSYPDTSQSGSDIAESWRAYIEGIKRAKSAKATDTKLDLDDAMPYATAAGVASALSKQLEQASDHGYAPVWLGPTSRPYSNGYTAFAAWTAFTSTVTPSSSSTGSVGGASAGGGGAGGSF